MNLIPEFVCANFSNKKLTKRLLKIVQSIASNITDSVSGCMQKYLKINHRKALLPYEMCSLVLPEWEGISIEKMMILLGRNRFGKAS